MSIPSQTDDPAPTRNPSQNESLTENARERAARKLRLALALFEDGVAMQRLNLQRSYPTASAEEIDAKLGAWLRNRSCEQPGVRGPWPRR